MSVKDNLLELLEQNRGVYISGAKIAETLNVSRTAIWKYINSLRDAGYDISAVTNKGYMLSPKTNILSSGGISKYMDPSIIFRPVVKKSVTSTNLVLKECAHEENEGLAIIASEQTCGMGRLGRTFFSPSDTGVYFSILLKPDINGDDITLLTSIAAVCVCEAIEKYTEKKPSIKWVNDVWLDGKKISGTLTQASLSMEIKSPEYVIVGTGINIYPPEKGFDNELKKIAGCICNSEDDEIKYPDLKNKIVAEYLNRYHYYYKNFSKKDFIKKYKKRCFVFGKKINIISGKCSKIATALDIDDMCHLLVRYEDGTEEYISTGEISIRPVGS